MTMRSLKCVAAAAVLAVAGSSAMAADEVLLSEGFENLTSLFDPIANGGGGWSRYNFSDNKVGDGWVQGVDDALHFPAQAGSNGSYIASGYFIQDDTVNPIGAADGLVLTKAVSLAKPTQLSFWTRTIAGNAYGETLYVGYALGNAIFTDYLSVINEEATAGVYPEGWSKYTVNLGAQGTGVTGRFLFEYYIQDISFAGNYVGLDSVTIAAVPEPGTWLLMGLGVAALAGFARRRAA